MIIIPDILENFISGINLKFTPLEISTDGISTYVKLDNILFARAGIIATIHRPLAEFNTIQSVNHSTNTITLIGDVSDLETITLPTPFFFHGTPYATNSHLSNLDDTSKVPMIYLYEILRETFGDRLSKGIEAEIKLFFLDVANFEDWTTDDHYSNVIQGQRKFVDYFISRIRSNRKVFAEDQGGSIINHVKFGEYVDRRGHKASIFNDRLSGVELNMRLNFNCCNC